MTVYFIRYGDLIKIGYSRNLQQRVSSILNAIPGEAAFIGHMPGDRDLEAHLHERFATRRFSGEWFVSDDDIEAFARIALSNSMPMPEVVVLKSEGRLISGEPERVELAELLRRYASRNWPDHTHAQRKKELAVAMGVTGRRVKSLYEAEPTYTLRASEKEAIKRLSLQADAFQIEPEPEIRGDEE